MNKLLGGLMLVLMSSNALADWTNVGENGGSIIYANYSSIRTNGENKKMWVLQDFKTIQSISTYKYLSTKSINEYDCQGVQLRLLAYTWFEGNMGTGKVVYSHDETLNWQQVQPESIGEVIWKVACGKQ